MCFMITVNKQKHRFNRYYVTKTYTCIAPYKTVPLHSTAWFLLYRRTKCQAYLEYKYKWKNKQIKTQK